MDAAAFEDLQEVFLARLAEGEAVEGEVVFQALVAGAVAAEGEGEQEEVGGA